MRAVRTKVRSKTKNVRDKSSKNNKIEQTSTDDQDVVHHVLSNERSPMPDLAKTLKFHQEETEADSTTITLPFENRSSCIDDFSSNFEAAKCFPNPSTRYLDHSKSQSIHQDFKPVIDISSVQNPQDESIKVETPDVPVNLKLKFKICKSSLKSVTISKSVNSRSLRNGNRKIDYCEKDILVFNSDISVFKRPEASAPKRSGFDCDFCGKNFNQKVNLLTHCNRVHCDSKSFSCDFCSARSFSRQLDLTRHIAVCHEKKFRCKICSKNFGQKSVLQIHLKTVHLKVRDFACAFCDLSFGTNSSLKRHAASKHKTKVLKQCDQMLRSDHSDSQPQADPLTIESSVYKLDTLKTEPEFQSECNFDEDIDIKFEPLEDVEES